MASQEDCIKARHPSKIKREHTRNKLFTTTVQLVPGDVDRTKVNPFQGKRKIDGQWDEADYKIACTRSQMVRPRMRSRIQVVN